MRFYTIWKTKGIIEKCNSQWLSHPHLVRKKSGNYRVTVDFRRLNDRIEADGFPLPLLRSFTDELNKTKLFSAIDLKDAFYNIPITKESQKYTAFVTHNNIYQFKRLPMGLKSSPTVFQKIFSKIMENVQTETGRRVPIFIYIDDVLIPSRNRQEAVEDVRAVLRRLNENGFRINKEKCKFLAETINFLGYTVSEKGISPTTDKVEAIQTFPKPQRLNDLRRYLGMLNFYHNFCDKLADITAPLSNLLAGPQPKRKANPKIKWSEEAKNAFEKSKQALSTETLLVHRDPNAETAIFSDASSTALGAALQQKVDGVWQPLGFFSRKLSGAERKYSTFGRELLGMFAAEYFRPQVEGRIFHIKTDHKPLTNVMSKKGVRDLNREERQLQYISTFTTDIRHVSGEKNTVADALSRRLQEYLEQSELDNDSDENLYSVWDIQTASNEPGKNAKDQLADTATFSRSTGYQEPQVMVADNEPQNQESADFLEHCLIAAIMKATAEEELNGFNSPEEYRKIINEQHKCPELRDIFSGKIPFSPKLELYKGIYCNSVKGVRRIYLPVSMREEIFNKFHEHAHPGIKKAISYLTKIYIFPSMRKYITKQTRLCQTCAKTKIHKHNFAKIGRYADSSGRFQNIHLDLWGPVPPNSGYKYLFTCIDRYTRYPIVVPLTDAKTETVMEAYMLHVVAHWGPARTCVTDRGGQFTNSRWSDLMTSLNTRHVTTMSYNPRSNGAIERYHRTLNAAVKAHAQTNEQLWLIKLPYILLAIRNSIDEQTRISPAQAVYSQAIPLPRDLLPPYEQRDRLQVSAFAKMLQEAMQGVPPRVSRVEPARERWDPRLKTCTHVYVRRNNRKKMDNHYTGPYRVLHRGDTYFKVVLPHGEDNVSIDRLKAAWTQQDYYEYPKIYADVSGRPASTVTKTRHQPLTIPPITTKVTPPMQARQDVTLSSNAEQTFPRGIPMSPIPAGNDAERQVINQHMETTQTGDTQEAQPHGHQQQIVKTDKPNPKTTQEVQEHNEPVVRTRSGRISRPPERFTPYLNKKKT